MGSRAVIACLARLLFFVVFLAATGCDGPGRVQYDGGRCFKDGRALTLQDVEAEQAAVARRIASRQPWFAVITIGVVLIAAASNAERALLLFQKRHVEGHRRTFAERLRELLARQRDNPFVFAVIVGSSLALILIGAGFYAYLDIDKRASERALGMLQFCHIALGAQEEQAVLDQQRFNLEAIQSTAGDIRTLVGKLPPDEQRKAQLIVSQMNDALAKQGKIVGAYVARTDEAQKELSTHSVAMEKGLASVEGNLAELRSLPTNVKDLESATHRIDQATTSIDGRFDELQGALDGLRGKVTGVEAKVDAVLARPACPVIDVTAAPRLAASASPSASARAAEPPPADGGSAQARTP